VLGDLAIVGGPPQFSEPLHVGRPNIGDRDDLLQRIGALLDRRWFTNDGPLVHELEEAVAEAHDVAGAVAVCNATLGLQLLARGLGLRGEILMPAFTFIATAHAVMWQGAQPEFVDIRRVDHNVDVGAVEAAITERTGGIVGVHLWGRPCPVAELTAVADAHGLPLVFDAAHAFGVRGPDGVVGGGGRAEVLSLHATKFVNSFEGGIVVGNDAALLDEIRSLRNFGFVDYDTVTAIGTNAKMPEVCAAMGLTSLESAASFALANRENFEAYRTCLVDIPGVRLLDYDRDGTWNYQYVVVEIDPSATGMDRDTIVAALHAENVLARRYFYPGCHRHPPYVFSHRHWNLPITDDVAARVLVLPTGSTVSPDTCRAVGALVEEVMAGGARLAARVAAAIGHDGDP
jgi:dTDP-4-amino-4,6-dideoxygalactose transaminase